MSNKNCIDIPESFWESEELLAIARYCKIAGVNFSAIQDKFRNTPQLYNAAIRRHMDTILKHDLLSVILCVEYVDALALGKSKLKTRKEFGEYLEKLGKFNPFD